MISAQVLGEDKLNEQLKKATPKYLAALTTAMHQAVIRIQSTVKTQYLDGKPLAHRSGNLTSSIRPKVTREGDAVLGRVGTNVFYGRLHEFGGTFNVPAHTRNGKNVAAHSMTFPPRPFMAPAYADSKDRILQIFKDAVRQASKEL